MLQEVYQSPYPLHRHYNIEYVKQRLIPTYSHTQIFQGQPININTRFTPTFHSTALEVQDYHSNAKQQVKTSQIEKEHLVIYKNVSFDKKQQELNPLTARFYESTKQNNWYDNSKKELLESLCFTQRYPKDRKLADLSSNPIFGGTFMQICQKPTLKEQQNQEKTSQKHQKDIHQQILQTQNQAKKQVQNKQVDIKQNHEKSLNKLLNEKPAIKVQHKKINKNQSYSQKNPKKDILQKYSIKDEITFGKNSKGKKLQKNITVGSTPAFTLIKKGKA